MSGSRLNKFFALLLTVNMIGSGVGIEVAAATAEDDGEEVVVSFDLSDYLHQGGATPGLDDIEEVRDLVPDFVSGDYDSYRVDFLHRRGKKHKNADDPAENMEAEEVQDKVDEEPVDKPVEESVEEEPKVSDPEPNEPEVSEPESAESVPTEPESTAAEETESKENEPKETEPAVTQKDEEVVETATAKVPVYNTELQLSEVKKLLGTACKNWNGTDKQIKVDVTDLGVTVEVDENSRITGGNLTETVSYFINTHGEYFFLDLSYTCSYNKTTKEVKQIVLGVSSKYTKSDVDKFNKKVEEIMNQVDPHWSDLEKALFLHDYLVTHCDYDLDPSNYHYDSYNCLVKGSCVCQGYSLTYDYLCRLAGVSCYYISSSKMCHAWNMVKIDGKEYFIDSTWDDPLISTEEGNQHYYKTYCAHRYFLLSGKAMYNKNHSQDDWVIDARKSANSHGTDTTYDKFFWSSSISKFAPISGHKWAYVTPNASKVMSFDFSNNSADEISGTVDSFTYASLASVKGDVYVSTCNKIYKIGPNKATETVFDYSGTDGKIYGIEVNGSKLTYYIYKNVTEYVKKGVFYLDAEWERIGGNWYYRDSNGKFATGLQVIDKETYLFDDSGAMLTGWRKLDDGKHYFRDSGEMVTGWESIGSKYYYFNSHGVMQTGFIKSGSTTYYCDPNGVRLTGWQQIGKYWYYFSSNKGKMATGWKTISKKQYFFSEKGIMRTGFRSIGGKTYYFTSKGVMKTGWFKKSGNDYYANSKGVVYMKKWKKTGGKWYYLGSDGIMLKSCTKKISGKKYKFNSKGVCTNKK